MPANCPYPAQKLEHLNLDFISGLPHEKGNGTANDADANALEADEETLHMETELGVGMPSTNGSGATIILKWIQSFKQDFMYVSETGETYFRDCLNRESVKAIWDRMSHWITRTDILTVHKKIKQLQIDMRIAFKKLKTSS